MKPGAALAGVIQVEQTGNESLDPMAGSEAAPHRNNHRKSSGSLPGEASPGWGCRAFLALIAAQSAAPHAAGSVLPAAYDVISAVLRVLDVSNLHTKFVTQQHLISQDGMPLQIRLPALSYL